MKASGSGSASVKSWPLPVAVRLSIVTTGEQTSAKSSGSTPLLPPSPAAPAAPESPPAAPALPPRLDPALPPPVPEAPPLPELVVPALAPVPVGGGEWLRVSTQPEVPSPQPIASENRAG